MIHSSCRAIPFLTVAFTSAVAYAEPPVEEVAPVPAAPASSPPTGSVTGLTIEGRLGQTVAPIGLGAVSDVALASFVGGLPPATIGYRGNGYSLVIGPSFGRISTDQATSTCNAANVCTPGTTTSSVTFFGATIVGEFDLARSRDRRMEAYLLLAAHLAIAGESSSPSTTASTSSSTSSSSNDDGVSGHPAFGFAGGLGLRYWIVRNLGIGAELGESYLNLPLGSSSSASSSGSSTTTDLRGSIISTFGALNVSLAFGK